MRINKDYKPRLCHHLRWM